MNEKRTTPDQYSDGSVLVDRDGNRWTYDEAGDVWHWKNWHYVCSYQRMVFHHGPTAPPPLTIKQIHDYVITRMVTPDSDPGQTLQEVLSHLGRLIDG